MREASGTRSLTSLSSHYSEGSTPVSPRKRLLPSVLSWLVSLTLQYPFLSITLVYAFLVGTVAGVAKWSYNREVRNPDGELQPNKSGVGFSLTSPTLARFWLTTTHRRLHSSDIGIG